MQILECILGKSLSPNINFDNTMFGICNKINKL